MAWSGSKNGLEATRFYFGDTRLMGCKWVNKILSNGGRADRADLPGFTLTRQKRRFKVVTGVTARSARRGLERLLFEIDSQEASRSAALFVRAQSGTFREPTGKPLT